MSWRRTLAKFVPQSNLLSSIALSITRRGAAVFMFHRVLPPGTPNYDAELVTSTQAFEGFLQWLSGEFEIVTLSAIAGRLLRKQKLQRACALSFDDGWIDNYTFAFPLLSKFKAPATIFLASGFIGKTRRLWQEKLWYLLSSASQSELNDFLRNWLNQHQISARLPDDLEFNSLRTLLRTLGSDQAEAFVDELQTRLAPRSVPTDRAFMNWDEVREMQRAGVEFGAHTKNHVFLPAASAAAARDEIEGSRSVIESEIRSPVAGFSYPWGALTPSVRKWVEAANFEYAVGVQPGIIRAASNRFVLPRIFIGDSVLHTDDGLSPTVTAAYIAMKSVSGAGERSY